jgi:hypothetical protein
LIFFILFPACTQEILLTPREYPELFWYSQNVVPPFARLEAVWGTSPSNVYAVGDRSVILHFDGESWSEEETPSRYGYNDIWGSSPTDIYAVGTDVAHFNGVEWTDLDLGISGSVRQVWGTSSTDLYFRSWAGVFHYDGTTLTELGFGENFSISDLWASGPDDVYVVTRSEMVHHYDGTEWSEYELAAPVSGRRFYEVSGASANNVLVCGSATMLYDGADWVEIAHEDISSISAVWCNGANDYFAAADDRLLRCDGTGWREISRMPEDENWSRFEGIWVDQSEATFAVGDNGDIWRCRGGEIELFNMSYMRLDDIWGSSHDDVYAVGRRGTILHFDGESWSSQPPFTEDDIRKLWGTAADDVYAIAWRYLYHFDGSEWSQVPDAPDIIPLDVWRAPEGDLFLVGERGVSVRHLRNWKTTEAILGLQTVWGPHSKDVFAAGGRTLLHFDGSGWSLKDHKMGSIDKLWGFRGGDTYAGASEGLFKYDGRQWSRVDDEPPLRIGKMWGWSGDNLFLVTTGGFVFRFDGSRRDLYLVHDDFRLTGMWGDSPDEIFACGAAGELLRFVPEEQLP